MAVKKAGTSFVCYLLDFGNLVTISQTNMRPLPSEFLARPPCAFQVYEISGVQILIISQQVIQNGLKSKVISPFFFKF